MAKSSAIERLAKAIEQATRSAKFCVAGGLPVVDPGIEVDGLGAVTLPLKRGVAKKLIALCRVAPYGKGTRTLVDKTVRRTFELNPQTFRLSDAWNAAIDDAMRPVADQLGLPAERLEPRLYKLLVHEKGGFFLPHRDSELASVRQKLEAATARRPAPPADWARPADLTFQCDYCGELKAFLADPANQVGRIAAREDLRQHLIDRSQSSAAEV